jgi:hypothetical protein
LKLLLHDSPVLAEFLEQVSQISRFAGQIRGPCRGNSSDEPEENVNRIGARAFDPLTLGTLEKILSLGERSSKRQPFVV